MFKYRTSKDSTHQCLLKNRNGMIHTIHIGEMASIPVVAMVMEVTLTQVCAVAMG